MPDFVNLKRYSSVEIECLLRPQITTSFWSRTLQFHLWMKCFSPADRLSFSIYLISLNLLAPTPSPNYAKHHPIVYLAQNLVLIENNFVWVVKMASRRNCKLTKWPRAKQSFAQLFGWRAGLIFLSKKSSQTETKFCFKTCPVRDSFRSSKIENVHLLLNNLKSNSWLSEKKCSVESFLKWLVMMMMMMMMITAIEQSALPSSNCSLQRAAMKG